MPRATAAYSRNPARRTGSDAALAVAVIGAVIALQYPFRLRWVSLLDEGVILQIASDIQGGHRLYVDAIHYALPGIFYVLAAAFALFGASIETARTLAIVIFGLLSGVTYLISRWWYGRVGAAAVVALLLVYRVWAFPHWQMLSYSSTAVMLAIAATWLVGESLGRRRIWLCAAAGVLSAAATLCKQDSGAMATIALGLTLVLCHPVTATTRMRRVVAFVAGGGAATATVAIAIWAAGIGPELVRQAILAPLYAVQNFEYVGKPSLWPLFAQDPTLRDHAFSYLPSILVDLHWTLVTTGAVYRDTALVDIALKLTYLLPWLVLLVATPLTVRRLCAAPSDLRSQRELLLVLLAASFLAAFNRPQDWVHLLVLYPPTLLLGAALVSRWAQRRSVVVLSLAATGGAFLVSAALAHQFANQHNTPVVTPRGVLYTRPRQAAALQSIVDVLGVTNPGTPLAALPYDPLLNFLTGRSGLTRFYLVWPVERDGGRDEAIIARLEANPDAVVVYNPAQFPQFPAFAKYAPQLYRYLVDNYTVTRRVGDDPYSMHFLVLQRNSPAAHRAGLE